ncbi:MAG: IS630 family transposase, partial [Moorea sp. SIO4A1]|nr:IS630 family transposase [Moorena sp. SIO4A1]
RLRVPRPEHQQADWKTQEEWKKKLAAEVLRVQQEYPDATVEKKAEDEHRIGAATLTRRIWIEAGVPPIGKVNWKREWLWLYGASPTPNGRN